MKRERLDIVYEDKHLIIVNKKGNIPTIKSDKYKDNLYSQVYDYLHKKNHKVFVVHRLDKDTSGMVIFAKTQKVKEDLQDNWDNVIRKYISVVHGKTKDSDLISSYLKETKTLHTYSTNDKSGKLAKTKYKLIKSNKQYSLIEIELLTGRKNQIRVHMQDNKTPIVGDKKYGKKDGYRTMFLFENYLEFIHPVTKQKLIFNLEVPENYKKMVI